jgi:hypothetical protein
MWNLVNQKFVKPAVVTGWAIVVYDTRSIRQPDVDFIIQGLRKETEMLGGFLTTMFPTY